MLNSNEIIESRLEEIKKLQKAITTRQNNLAQLENCGEQFIVDSTYYFKYSVKIVFATALAIIILVGLLIAQVYFSVYVDSKGSMPVPSYCFVMGFAFVVLATIFYTHNQKSNLMSLSAMNKKAAGWFDDVVSLIKIELNELIEEYDSLVSNDAYIGVLDDSAQEIAKDFLKNK